MSGKVTILTTPADELPLEDESVDLIVTSPPYWMLREYRDGGVRVEGQIGLEPTWEGYIDSLVRCTREWVRVLKPTGSLWVNLGDKYGRGTRTTVHGGHSKQAYVDGDRPGVCAPTGYEKSLIGLPWRYAFRCTDDLGLKLRAEVVWAKKNGLPESVQDRVRRSHEQFFHFTKQETYYSAVDDIRVPYQDADFAANGQRATRAAGTDYSNQRLSTNYDMGEAMEANPRGRLPGSVWEIASEPLNIPEWLLGDNGEELDHYAAYPTALVRPVIKAWCPKEICCACGQGRFPVGRERTVGYACACTPYTDYPERRGKGWHESDPTKRDEGGAIPLDGGQVRANGVREAQGPVREYDLVSWEPPPSVPGTVLDPFGGTGTSALVADVHGRNGISADLSKDYAKIASWRVHDGPERARALGEKRTPKAKRVQEHLYGDLFAELDEMLG
jgi:DNA modification methylase